ncbi:hypothetical protein NDU88_004019 [Pleurodeles waltl]|uniref:Uncharacterized protein n=1 Tax=Pleurodeles waltl TaxID=8319 RepID=A0AAV7KZQ8_PLEWA|nr:hypothetical protein NDU88_004019 [Pleurodeles waltl]
MRIWKTLRGFPRPSGGDSNVRQECEYGDSDVSVVSEFVSEEFKAIEEKDWFDKDQEDLTLQDVRQYLRVGWPRKECILEEVMPFFKKETTQHHLPPEPSIQPGQQATVSEWIEIIQKGPLLLLPLPIKWTSRNSCKEMAK